MALVRCPGAVITADEGGGPGVPDGVGSSASAGSAGAASGVAASSPRRLLADECVRRCRGTGATNPPETETGKGAGAVWLCDSRGRCPERPGAGAGAKPGIVRGEVCESPRCICSAGFDAEKDDDADAVGGGTYDGGEAVVAVAGKKPYGTALDELEGLRVWDTLRLWCGDEE